MMDGKWSTPLMFIRSREDAQQILNALRWHENMIVMNYEGSLVWLGPCFDDKGKRIGITDCCFASNPCDHHKALAKSSLGKDAH